MNVLREQVRILSKDAADWETDVDAINRCFGRSDWGGKPFGYDVQLIWVKKQEKDARRIRAQAAQARVRFRVLESVLTVIERSVA